MIESLMLLVGILFRIVPSHIVGKKAGVDLWYWKKYIEIYKTTRKIPPKLPVYVLEKNQWSPPVFPLLLGQFPTIFLDRFGWLAAFVIDLLRMALLLLVTVQWTDRTTVSIILAGVVYATSPNLVTYNIQLNPRGLAALFLDAGLILGFIYLFQGGPFWIVLLSGILFGLVLNTHKMTTQLLLFLGIFMAALYQNPIFLAVLPLSFLFAMALSKGFYWNVFKSNMQAFRFWTQHWNRLLADPLKESPIYGIKDYVTPGKQFHKGIRNYFVRFISIFFGNYSPWVTMILILSFLIPVGSQAEIFIRTWFYGTITFAVLTVIVPKFRGLGFGNLYLYNATFPGALYLAMMAQNGHSAIWPLFFVFLIYNLTILVRTLKQMRNNICIKLPDDVVSKIKESGEGNWISFPLTLVEQVMYFGGKSVLWAGHCEWDYLKPVYPVVTQTFEELRARYDLKYILAFGPSAEYMDTLKFNKEKTYSSGSFHIYKINGN